MRHLSQGEPTKSTYVVATLTEREVEHSDNCCHVWFCGLRGSASRVNRFKTSMFMEDQRPSER
jgi:hypothetical protein